MISRSKSFWNMPAKLCCEQVCDTLCILTSCQDASGRETEKKTIVCTIVSLRLCISAHEMIGYSVTVKRVV